jgi:hypothetical protein
MIVCLLGYENAILIRLLLSPYFVCGAKREFRCILGISKLFSHNCIWHRMLSTAAAVGVMREEMRSIMYGN